MKYWIPGLNCPLTKNELLSQYGSKLKADSPCAAADQNKWGKISDYFPDWPNPGPQRPGTLVAEPSEPVDRYPVLAFLSKLYRILAIFNGVAAVVMIFAGVYSSQADPNGTFGWLLIIGGLIGGPLGVITCLAISELITLLVDIEKNTRASGVATAR